MEILLGSGGVADTEVYATDPRIRIVREGRRRWALLVRKTPRHREARTVHKTRAAAAAAGLPWLAENPAPGSALEALRSSLAGTPGFEPHFAAFVAGDPWEYVPLRDRLLDHGREPDDELLWAAADELADLGVMPPFRPTGHPHWRIVTDLAASTLLSLDTCHDEPPRTREGVYFYFFVWDEGGGPTEDTSAMVLPGGWQRDGRHGVGALLVAFNIIPSTAGSRFRDDELDRIRRRLGTAGVDELGLHIYPEEEGPAGYAYAMVLRGGEEERGAVREIVREEAARTIGAIRAVGDRAG
jgi:hypothetical protein